ncbi:MAG: extracellular solute-binding protein [Thermoproteales archaeon]|nr:extracellular solute-binding protein [Thermoproteales archaeon]
MKKGFLILLIFLVLILPYFANIGNVNAQPEKKQLLIISPHWEGIRKEYGAAFAKWYKAKYGQDVEVVWTGLGTSDCVKSIEDWYSKHTEGKWDIMWGGGVDPFLKLKSEGLLESFNPDEDPEFKAILAKIPKDFAGIPMYDTKDYTWFGTALSGFGIIYNKKVLSKLKFPEPKTWEDITNDKLIGWVSSADPRHSGSTHMAYEIILQAYGWEKGWEIITKLGGNVKDFPQHSSTVPSRVAAGEAAYGLAIDFYAWAQIAKVGAENIGYVMPEGLTVINPDSIAILKNPPHKELAKIFIKFVLSEDGQKLWMLPAGKYPDGPSEYNLGRMCVIPDLYDQLKDKSIVPVNPFVIKSTLEYNSTKGGTRWSIVNDMIGALIIDTHDNLVAAWKKIAENKDKLPADVMDKIMKEFTKVPVDEKTALQYASKWSDQTFRNQKISEWRTFALNKYKNTISMVDEALKSIEAQKQQQQMMMIAGVVIVIIVVVVFYYLKKKPKQ